MTQNSLPNCLLTCVLSGVVATLGLAANDGHSRTVRAPLPRPETFPRDLFFKDAFREALVGHRPAKLGQASTPKNKPTRTDDEVQASAGTGWSRLVSAETLESEVKALQMSMDQNITTPARFSSGGFKVARREFSELAVLFAVISEFDGKVRWHEQAPLIRDRFARAAANAKVSSPQAFQEAKQRKLDLKDLVRGASLATNETLTRTTDWEHVADRRPLMERFTTCYDEGIAKWTANTSELAKHNDAITREAELLRMFAMVLTRDGMEDAGDDDYEAYCQQLVLATDDLLEAARVEDYPAVREAAGNIGQACNRCHEDYRG